MAKTKTQTHKGEKIQLIYDYTIDYITLTVKFENQITIRYADNKGLSDYEKANKLLQLYFKLLDMTISEIEKALHIKITAEGIKDNTGQKINIVLI